MAQDLQLLHLLTRAELRSWLEAHHLTSPGAWLVSWRSTELGPQLDYEDTVEELLCFAWIDSTVRTLDENRRAMRITPRRPGSGWAATNKARVERLLAAGLMRPAGLAAVDRAKADGSWTLLDDVEALIVPDDLAAALSAAGARELFDGLTAGRRKQTLYWIKTAKRPATRAARIDKTVAAAQTGRSPVA